MNTLNVAFWNLENLFDVKNSPRRSDKLKRTLANELNGWNGGILEKKLSQLNKVIRHMNDEKGPDILGVCEVENEYVLKLLADKISSTNSRYVVAHHDTRDKRGIDVAFLIKESVGSVTETFFHDIQKRTATRDIFQANIQLENGKTLVVIANHWPSRSGGQYKSEPYRMMAGENLAYFHERIRQKLGEDVAIIAMGDFNDEPFDRSLVDYALSERIPQKVINSRSPKFLNVMWGLMGTGIATHYYNNSPNLLDQFMISKGLLTRSTGIKAELDSVKIVRLPDMVNAGDYPSPIRFGRGDSINESGFSDHFPISINLTID